MSLSILKAVLMDEQLQIQQETYVHFDNDLPEFGTSGGIIKNTTRPNVKRAPTLMWVKALDILLEKMQNDGIHFNKIAAISGCAQQHGTVYWSKGSRAKLKNLNSSKFLYNELSTCFSLLNSPTWMDSSTKKECDLLENTVGGALTMAQITGSRAYERFSGPQIAKVYREEESAYFNTERISMVSNFLASLFLGDYAPIDWSDGSGMNLLNLRTKMWDNKLLEACAPGLENKLGESVPTQTVLGNISKYYIEKYGFNSTCNVVAFTGDNPSSLAGMCLRKGDLGCSLGTSDAYFLCLNETKVIQNGHILCNPLDKETYMALVGFRNGSLTRERIRNEYANGSWKTFNDLLKITPRGNSGNIAMYFDTQEILPSLTGDYRYNAKNEQVKKFSSNETDVRAVIEGQFIIRRLFAEDFGLQIGSETRIIATGGASENKAILQILADVFNSSVYILNTTNTAALGGAYLAKNAVSKCNVHLNHESEQTLVCQPHKDAQKIYDPMIVRMRSNIEELLLKK